jgi:hypothetical protein
MTTPHPHLRLLLGSAAVVALVHCQAETAPLTPLAWTFDSGGLTTPSVFLDASGWNMYYAGFDTTGQYSAGLARAPR